MKKRIVIRSVMSRPPTEKQLDIFYEELARITATYYLKNNAKIVIKTGESDYALSEPPTGEPHQLQESGI